MGKIIVQQFFFCQSFAEAVEIGKTYATFKIHHYDLGRGQTITFRKTIRKFSSASYTHLLTLFFSLNCGDFSDYGYIDPVSLKRYPELPDILRNTPDDNKLDVILEYSHKSDALFHDLIYYVDFDQYYKYKLQKTLDQIALAGTIALAGRSHTNCFGVQYEERGQALERNYFAYEAFTPYEDDEAWTSQGRKYLLMADVWNWMQNAQHKYVWKKQNTSVPITALSYVMNRMPIEQLIYAVIGLESVYVSKNQKHKQEQLKLLLPQACPGITQEDIGRFYSLRSELIHGDLPLPVCSEETHFDPESMLNRQCFTKAGVALIMTLRTLVEHNAFRIRNNGAGGIRYLQESDL